MAWLRCHWFGSVGALSLVECDVAIAPSSDVIVATTAYLAYRLARYTSLTWK